MENYQQSLSEREEEEEGELLCSISSGLSLDVDVVVVGALRGVKRMLAASEGLVEDHPFGAVSFEAHVHHAYNVHVAIAGVPVPAIGVIGTEGGS